MKIIELIESRNFYAGGCVMRLSSPLRLHSELKIDAQWRLRFEVRVHQSPWNGPRVLWHPQCSETVAAT
jgi:hypothetical protein